MFATPKFPQPKQQPKKKNEDRDKQYYDFVRKTLMGKIDDTQNGIYEEPEFALRMETGVKYALITKRDGYHIEKVKSSNPASTAATNCNNSSSTSNISSTTTNTNTLQIQFEKTYQEIKKLSDIIQEQGGQANADQNTQAYIQASLDRLIQELVNLKIDGQQNYSVISNRVTLTSDGSFAKYNGNGGNAQNQIPKAGSFLM
mgnify:CR=1 FL=1|jgi:hypothetical protein